MSLVIKQEYFNQILKDIEEFKLKFDSDGCACGELEIQLNEKLWLYIYRCCRKSNSIPDNKLWHIEDFLFYEKSLALQREEDVWLEPINIGLDELQEQALRTALIKQSYEIWGNQYRYED